MQGVNIVAYLSPHPLDDDLATEVEWVSWIPGFNHDDDADGMGIIYNDCNVLLYKSIEKQTTEIVKSAFNNLYPLFENHIIKDLFVWIDLFGIMGNKHAIAGYHYDKSKPANGKYQFNADHRLMVHYLSKNWRDLSANPKVLFTWEHELLHMLDHQLIEKVSVYKSSGETSELYKYFILKFREEGFAELYYLLLGNFDEILSIEQAKTAFLKLDLDVKRKMKETGLFPEEVYEQYDYYELGPWLMLDCLRSFEGGFHEVHIENALLKIGKKEAMPREEIFTIIQIAIRMDIQTVFDYFKNYSFQKTKSLKNPTNSKPLRSNA
jgi:hypothetical protein